MFRRVLPMLMASMLLVALVAVPAVADPPSQEEVTIYCEGDIEYTLQMSPGVAPWPLFEAEGTMTAMPMAVYFSDEEGTRGDLFYRPPGLGLDKMPTTWCTIYQMLPGWPLSPDWWMGADWIITR